MGTACFLVGEDGHKDGKEQKGAVAEDGHEGERFGLCEAATIYL